MDERVSLKRSKPGPSYCDCIICHESKRDVLYSATTQGLLSLKVSAEERRKLRDIKSTDTIDRILNAVEGDMQNEFHWHKSCFAVFTDKGKINRLKKSHRHSAGLVEKPPATVSNLRSSTSTTDWELCLFCQRKQSNEETLCSITTFKVSKQIIDGARCDHSLSVRVAGVTDLIAVEGKYHPNCYKKFLRNASRSKEEATDEKGVVLAWIVNDLKKSAEKGHILELKEVFSRYCALATEQNIEVPPSFLSRMSTFKEYLQPHLVDLYDFIKLQNVDINERQMVLVPNKLLHIPVSQLLNNDSDTDDDEHSIPVYMPQEQDDFLSMVHVALKLRSDILAHPSHKGINVSKEDAIACIPDSVYMFVRLLLGGQSLLETAFESGSTEGEDDGTDDEVDLSDDEVENDAEPVETEDKQSEARHNKRDQHVETRVLSVAQDLVYTVSGGEKWTPKHIGLGASLHQATRSRKLVELFHNAGHIISYKDILRVDTALATHTLSSMDADSGSVIPTNLAEGRFIHFSADNIDINEGTLDGQNTFHATQYAAWQRGPESVDLLESIYPTTETTLKVPEEMNMILPAYILEGSAEPEFKDPVQEEWYEQQVDDCSAAVKAEAADMAFHMIRQYHDPKPGWTTFNEEYSETDPEVSTVGYMPIILAPAHDVNTLNTVVRRITQVAKSFNQIYVVLTVDQALFPLLMELKWAVPEYRDTLIPRLGGLHISMNFLKVLGQHMQDSGLSEIWVESALLGPRTVERVLEGKEYSKGVRAHKVTLQAIWQILLPQLLAYIGERDKDLKESLDKCAQSHATGDFERMCDLLSSDCYRALLSSFVASKKESNPSFQFWWQYTEMVCILLRFTRAQREGQWHLHMYAFQEMLPFFHRYDHTNYARWGPVYLAQMKQLPAEVQAEFESGNWVVKGSSRRFNQVDPDQAQEWLNGTGKRGGGIVGITRTPSALFRWTLSYSLRALIAAKTRKMYHLDNDDHMTYNESKPSRKRRDGEDEKKVKEFMQESKVFDIRQQETVLDKLQNIVTKDVATAEIQESLLNAPGLGKEKLLTFVKERLVLQSEENKKKKLRDPLPKNKAPTFATLREVETKVRSDKSATVVKAEKNVMQRIITAFDAGRKIDLLEILSHELTNVPVSVLDKYGCLRSGNKSLLSQVLSGGLERPHVATPTTGHSQIVIDGQALVMSLGQPSDCSTFGEYAGKFVRAVLRYAKDFHRVDVTFDRYREMSIKNVTRKKRAKGCSPIRRAIEDGSVPLPRNWSNFLALGENKADLARFLSEELLRRSPDDKTIIVAGGFQEENVAKCSRVNVDTTALQGRHEEADTRMILHCVNSSAEFVVVCSNDTDVLVLLIAHFDKMRCRQLWMRAGTSKKPKYLPVHTVRESMKPVVPNIETILCFHAVTGCDTVSFFAGHSKKTAWKTFLEQPALLDGLGSGELNNTTITSAEKFICRVYGSDEESCNRARVTLFSKCRASEALPPTSDAAEFHIRRAHYQALVWRQAHLANPALPPIEQMGWNIVNGIVEPKLMSLAHIPQSCAIMVSCGCKSGCKTNRCSCRTAGLPCTGVCKCGGNIDKPCQNTGNADQESNVSQVE